LLDLVVAEAAFHSLSFYGLGERERKLEREKERES